MEKTFLQKKIGVFSILILKTVQWKNCGRIIEVLDEKSPLLQKLAFEFDKKTGLMLTVKPIRVLVSLLQEKEFHGK